MKKYLAAILLLLLAQQVTANNFFNQLCEFNYNWKKYEGRLPVSGARVFISGREYIQAHLSSVLTILATNPVTDLNAAQYRSRLHLISLLEEYGKAGNFPVNYYRHQRIPVFIDEHATHCAVGYLLQQTGHQNIALRIAAADNYAWVKDIKDSGLLAWQQSSGLSVEELKLIQGAYDFYMPNAFVLPNKYEIPQKPVCITAYFNESTNNSRQASKTKPIWCHGEGNDGVLNGRWEQNYAAGIPWIVGYFDNGKRTGQWMEYYQGTDRLCRTENWRDDKLNGIRKRFDRQGNIIEEILFKDGNAVTKTNYDLGQSLTWVRKQVDSLTVWTEVYTTGGGLLAAGHERIHNPGNLLWFQNIELTALNSAAIASRQIVTENNMGLNNIPIRSISFGKPGLYNTAPLVEYKKEGDWIYYKDGIGTNPVYSYAPAKQILMNNYRHFGQMLFQSLPQLQDFKINKGYDSIKVVYTGNVLQDFYGYGSNDYVHLTARYYERANVLQPLIKHTGQYDKENKKTGTWKHYDKSGALYKLENYIIPQSDEEDKREAQHSFQQNPVMKERPIAVKWKIKSSR